MKLNACEAVVGEELVAIGEMYLFFCKYTIFYSIITTIFVRFGGKNVRIVG